jgi:hypothetical protein
MGAKVEYPIPHGILHKSAHIRLGCACSLRGQEFAQVVIQLLGDL